ncbi:hypothetical protein [Saccharopolyspora erythraea]|uniref:hypothetical protein n=1 Tax=Saccharopolyspora erythraea TaxID=1836 RepID=UPI002012AB7F|nr:hypothetical protein [Saccharopolyspora erythraea]
MTNGRLTVAPCAVLLPPPARAVLVCAELVWAVLVRAALDRAEVDRAEVERVERVDPPVRDRVDVDLARVLVERRALLPPEVLV